MLLKWEWMFIGQKVKRDDVQNTITKTSLRPTKSATPFMRFLRARTKLGESWKLARQGRSWAIV